MSTHIKTIYTQGTQLAKEMCTFKTHQMLTQKEWIKINKRMNAILVEIDKLKEIEKTWNEFPDGTEETNQILKTIDEIADECRCSRNQVSMWLEIGLMRAIKTGKGYMIPKNEFERFIRDYLGYDVSNRIKALKAYEVVNGG